LREKRKIRRRRRQAGVALLLAIFVLLLVAVVGIAMMAASGTETSLTANYRSSTSAYYAALSGLEEGRGRLLPKNPNYLSCCIPPPGSTLPLGQVIYITNPLASDPVPSDPTNYGNPQAYPDTEYTIREGFAPPAYVKVSSVQTLPGSPNPLYKWVRINAINERAILVDVNNTNAGPPDSDWFGFLNTPQLIYFDGKNLTRSVTPYQALSVTALAALPDGSTKLLQYVVAPVALQIPISAALTIAGPNSVVDAPVFNQPSMPSYTFSIHGDDQAPGNNGGSPPHPCPVKPSLPAIGVLNSTGYTNVHDNTLVAPQPGNYTGGGLSTPSVSPNPYVHPSNTTVDMTDAVSLSNFLPIVQNGADSVLNGPRTEADMPSAMTSLNPMTVYVNGDLSLNSFTGYGLLVVRGNLTYSGDSGWKGIVIVLGGTITATNAPGSNGEFDGAVYLANLPTGGGVTLGQPTYNVANHAGQGIYYDSCWVAASLKPITYKVISFREIPYP
jgi:hypothetical protein